MNDTLSYCNDVAAGRSCRGEVAIYATADGSDELYLCETHAHERGGQTPGSDARRRPFRKK